MYAHQTLKFELISQPHGSPNERGTYLGDNCIQIFIWGGISSDIRSEI